MTKTYLGLSLLALGLASAAYAADHGPMGDPLGGKDVTKSEFLAKHGEMFDKMDSNKDGKLDTADRAAHMGEMFDKIDTDRNGSISREEFAAAHQKMGGPGGEHGDRGAKGGKHGGAGKGMMMLKMADANKDGAVSRDEFMAMAGQHFDKMDANKDGKLTKEERKAAHDKMKGMRGKRGEHGDHGGHHMPPPPAQ